MPRQHNQVDRRVNWTPELKERLAKIWNEGTPISVISLLLDKAPTLIQTRVARDGLSTRPVPEYAERHRNKWGAAELATLDALAGIRPGGPSFQEIEDMAIQLKRTIDSTAGKIGERHGPAALANVVDDYRKGKAVRRYVTNFLAENKIASGIDPIRCMRCRTPLFNVNPKITRFCAPCKRINSGASDSDIDFWS
jgi:hypothetical protein